MNRFVEESWDISFNAVCLHFFWGKNPMKVNWVVSNQDATTAGTKAFAPGSTEKEIWFSLHNLIKDFHGSDNHGVHASEITIASFSCSNLA